MLAGRRKRVKVERNFIVVGGDWCWIGIGSMVWIIYCWVFGLGRLMFDWAKIEKEKMKAKGAKRPLILELEKS